MIKSRTLALTVSSFSRDELLRDEAALELLLGSTAQSPEARRLAPQQVDWLVDNLRAVQEHKSIRQIYLSALVLENPLQHPALLRSSQLHDLLLMPLLNDNETMQGYTANILLSLAKSHPQQTLQLLRETPGLWDRMKELGQFQSFSQVIATLLCHKQVDPLALDWFIEASPQILISTVMVQMQKIHTPLWTFSPLLKKLIRAAPTSELLMKGAAAVLRMLLARQPLTHSQHQLFVLAAALPLTGLLTLNKTTVKQPNGQEVARVGLRVVQTLELVRLVAQVRPQVVTERTVQFLLEMFETSKWADIAFRAGTGLIKLYLSAGGLVKEDVLFWLMRQFRCRYYIYLSSGRLTTLGYFQFIKELCEHLEACQPPMVEHWREFVEKDLRGTRQLEEGTLGGEPEQRKGPLLQVRQQDIELQQECISFGHRKELYLPY